MRGQEKALVVFIACFIGVLSKNDLEISVFRRRVEGDVVGFDEKTRYQLHERLDYLGSPEAVNGVTLYSPHEHEADDNFPSLCLVPFSSSSSSDSTACYHEHHEQLLLDYTTSQFGYLTLLNDIRVKANASCRLGHGVDGEYCVDHKIFKGGHGEIWRAYKLSLDGIVEKQISYVLKRMRVADRPDILRCALREIHFGTTLKGVRGVARYVSYFKSDHGDDYWLVFKDEGISLQKLLYAVTIDDVTAMVEPSLLWRKLRKSPRSTRGIMQQVINCSSSYLLVYTPFFLLASIYPLLLTQQYVSSPT